MERSKLLAAKVMTVAERDAELHRLVELTAEGLGISETEVAGRLARALEEPVAGLAKTGP